MSANIKKASTKITTDDRIQQWLADDASDASCSELAAIRNAPSGVYEVVQLENYRRKRLISEAGQEAFNEHKFSFMRDIYFRGPSITLKRMLRKYINHCEIFGIEDFGNGFAQVSAYFRLHHHALIFEIMKLYPLLRVTCFAGIGSDNSVAFSETGSPSFTKSSHIDGAKDEGGHWMHKTDVFKTKKHRAFDHRTDSYWKTDYEYPFMNEWTADQYIVEEDKQYFAVRPAGMQDQPSAAAAKSKKPAVKKQGLTMRKQGFVIVDGVLKDYKGKATEITIPDGVTKIDCAFYGKENFYEIKSVFIPEGVREICECAFNKVYNLTNVVIPSTVRKLGIYSFADLHHLPGIVIPEGVTQIPACAFTKCFKLAKVVLPKSITSIDRSAFSGCCELTDINIPDSVKTIGPWAFYGCTSLTSLTIPARVKAIGRDALGKTSENLVVSVAAGSYAEQYCKENNIAYKYID